VIPQQVQNSFLTASRLFFAQPDEVKAEVSNLRAPHFRGWTRVATEHTAGVPDLREQLDVPETLRHL
jgi:isopenicillin N synthase-like dioxygenase